MRRDFQRTGTLAIFFLVLLLIGFSNEGRAADNYPTKPITVVIGYTPGSTDMGLKSLVDALAEEFGQQIVFVYKPGAAGSTGASFVAKSKPDGYTLLGTTQGSVVYAPVTKKLDYSLEDFTAICRYSMTPIGLAVKADSPFLTLKDVVAAAKKSPGKLTYATSGVYGTTHFALEMFERSAGIDLTHIPTAGSAAGVIALLGGHVDMAGSSMGPLLPHINSGAVRNLGFLLKDRSKNFPQTPTFSEQGYDVVLIPWYGLLGPKDMPKEIVEKINAAAKKAIEKYKSRLDEQLKHLGFEMLYMGSEEMMRNCREERETASKIFKELEAKPKK
jgi:tripartite-type tricarboxylate transporter receptor subunit TctC